MSNEISKITIHYEKDGKMEVATRIFEPPVGEDSMAVVYRAIKNFYDFNPINPNTNERRIEN